MNKPKLSLAALLSTTTLTGAVLLASVNPAQSFPCPLSKFKDVSESTSGKPFRLEPQNDQLNNLAIAGAGIAAVAGLFAIGLALKSRRTKDTQPVLADAPQEELLETSTLTTSVSQEVLASSTSKEDVSERDLTPVG